MSAVRNEQRGLGELFHDLSDETKRLIRQEVELAKTEVTEKVTFAAKNASMIGAGALVAYTGVQILLAALIIGIGHAIGFGFAALIVGVVVFAVGGIVAYTGINHFKSTSIAPKQTATQIQETKQWLARQM